MYKKARIELRNIVLRSNTFPDKIRGGGKERQIFQTGLSPHKMVKKKPKKKKNKREENKKQK